MVAFKYSLDPMIMKIQRDLRVNDQGFNIIFTGMPGSGKSLACASMCYAVDPTFSIKRCAFNVEEFIDLLNADLPKGSAIMWDESNIGNDAKNAMTVENKQMAFISQSMRSHNNFIALTTPSQDFQDKRTRLMLNAYVEMMPHESMNRLTGRSMGRYYVLQQNYRYSKIYFKSPVIQAYSGPVCLPVLKFKLPPKEFIEAYRERKRMFKKELYVDAKEIIHTKHSPKKRVVYPSVKEFVDMINVQGKTPEELTIQYNLGLPKIQLLRRLAKGEKV